LWRTGQGFGKAPGTDKGVTMTPRRFFPRRFTPGRRAVVAAVALAVCVFGVMSVDAFGQEADEAARLSAGFRKAAQRVLPAVVTVRAVGAAAPGAPFEPVPPRFPGGLPVPGPRLFPMPPPGAEGGGSGVVIDADKGYVLTNDHVVNGASRVVVILHNGRERTVSQVRRDPKSDLALLVIEPRGLSQAEWGDSSALETGDWVLAIGQPFGLSDTVTAGIVSGKGRGIGMAMYEDLIQTDAAINPGNSGGPLVNLKGEVVGISTALRSVRGGFEGVGFAVPASRAKRVAADLARFGAVRRAYLGVGIGPVDPATGERLEQPGAVSVNGVSPGSPAEKAGLKPGDIITRLQNLPVEGLGALQSAIEFAAVGEPLTITIDRNGKTETLQVSPEAQPERFGLPPADQEPARPRPRDRQPDREAEPAASGHFDSLGLTVSEVDRALTRRFRLRDVDGGLVITGVDPDGPADRSGLEAGTVITDAARKRVRSLDDFRDALKDYDPSRGLLLRVNRGGKREFRVIVGGNPTRPAEGEGTKDRDQATPNRPGR
jgi:serine protease Do